jgi:hypothetical protein
MSRRVTPNCHSPVGKIVAVRRSGFENQFQFNRLNIYDLDLLQHKPSDEEAKESAR